MPYLNRPEEVTTTRIRLIPVLFLGVIIALGFVALPLIFGSMENEHPMENDTYAPQYEGLTATILGIEALWWVGGLFLALGMVIVVMKVFV